MSRAVLAFVVASLSLAGPIVASAQTASPADRDTTVQTSGPHGTSGAVGPNDNTDGSNKDGTRATTPPVQTQAAKPTRHHHAAKPTSATPLSGN